jgi:hypothetical protein
MPRKLFLETKGTTAKRAWASRSILFMLLCAETPIILSIMKVWENLCKTGEKKGRIARIFLDRHVGELTAKVFRGFSASEA